MISRSRLFLAVLLLAALLGGPRVDAQVQGGNVGQTGSITANDGACWSAVGVIKDCGFVPGSGTVTGPASATNGDIAVFSGTTGKVIADPGIPGQLTNSIAGDVALNNASNYFDGPVVFQGTTGTWCAIGQVTVVDSSTGATMDVELWDGTTIFASGQSITAAGNATLVISMSGCLTSPAGNIRISVKDVSSTSGTMKANASGNAKDSTITVYRIK